MRTKLIATGLALTALVGLIFSFSQLNTKPVHAAAATFEVTNTNASGAGSLAQAVSDANSNGNPLDQDVIEFNIATSGNLEIRPSSQLVITQSVIINGYTQGDAVANTADWPAPFDGIIRIGIDLSDVNAIDIQSDDVTLQGLAIYDSEGDDVSVTSPGNVTADGVDNLRLYGNYFDTEHNGLTIAKDRTSRNSVILTDTTNAIIGGASAAQRNLFGHCALSCLEATGSSTSGLRIKGNYIGLGSDGVTSLDNYAPANYGGVGIELSDGGSDVEIGGVGTEGNSIEHNYWGALSVEDFDDVSVLGNRVLYNVRADGHGNGLNGAGIFFGGVTNSVIGSQAAPNIIAGNNQGTITIDHSTNAGLGNQISDNVDVEYNLIGLVEEGGAAFPNTDSVRILGASNDIYFAHNKVWNTSDPVYTSDQGIYVTESSIVTILDNSIYNNERLGIELDHTIAPTNPAPTYNLVNETGGDSEVEFSLNTTSAADYRIQFFSNTELDGSGAGEGEILLGSTDITHSGGGVELFSYTLTGVTGINNLALTATRIDGTSPSGYGQTSEFGGLQKQADLQISTDDGETQISENTTDHEIEQTISNLGPNTVTDIEFTLANSTCYTITSVAATGTATTPGTYDTNTNDWTGVLEDGQDLVLTFTGDTSCIAGNSTYLNHYPSNMYDESDSVIEVFDTNEDFTDTTSLVRYADLEVSTTDSSTEVYENVNNHQITQTITNNGPGEITDIDFSLYDSTCYTITSVSESGTATNTGTYTGSPDYDWTGTLASGETLILTFTGTVDCNNDVTIGFNHVADSMQSSGISVTEVDDSNEDYSDNDTVTRTLTADLQFVTDDGVDSILTGSTDHEITQTITNLGPITVSDISFYDPTTTCFSITSASVTSGTATDNGAYDDSNFDWSGELQSGQYIIITFVGDTSACSGGSGVSFGHVRNLLELNGDGVYEEDASNEDYYETTSIVDPVADLSITKTLNNPQDLAQGATLEYTITVTNNGPQPFDISVYPGDTPGVNQLFFDLMPPDITFDSWSSTDDLGCTSFGPGSAAGFGASLGTHSDYEVVNCYETSGVEHILADDESVTGTMTVTVAGDSDLDFTNYAYLNFGTNDPTQALFAGYTGTTDLIDFIQAVDGDFNNFAESLPVSDLRVEKEKVEPFNGDQPGETVSYDVTIYNDGPMALDLDLTDPATNANMFVDLYPADDLTYVDSDDADIGCIDLGPGSIAYLGNAGADHPDHQLLICGYGDSGLTLASGASRTVRLNFTVNADPATSYTNYASHTALPTDTDSASLLALYGAATGDILDTIDNENFAKATYTDPEYEDDDGDGVRNGIEDEGPNSGDGNDDGTADKLQDNVASFISSVTGERSVLEVDGVCSITTTSVSSESGNEEVDASYNYPLGLVNFTLACDEPGATTNVKIYYFNESDQGFRLRKYNVNTDVYSTIVTSDIEELTIDSQSVLRATYSVTDGGVLDQDQLENSTIVDPVGLGASIPDISSTNDTSDSTDNLSETGADAGNLLLLAITLIVLGLTMKITKIIQRN